MKYKYTLLFSACVLLLFVFSSKKIKTNKAAGNMPLLSVNKTDTSLRVINGSYFYRQQLFSGVITELYDNGAAHHKTSCGNGKEEGWTWMFYPDGKLSEKRYYHLGEKDSVHTGWWQNGNPRFEYHFTMSIYNGDYREWYNNGSAYKHIHYTNGTDDRGNGWRENGKLFMNYTMRAGRRYGIINSNLCYTLKNGQGEFAKATANTVEKKKADQ